MASKTDASGTRTYGYTAREQLSTETNGSTVNSFAYDAANNPTTVGDRDADLRRRRAAEDQRGDQLLVRRRG